MRSHSRPAVNQVKPVELEDLSISWLWWGLRVDLNYLNNTPGSLAAILPHLSLVLVSTLTESLSLASSNFLSSSSM